MSVCHLGAGDNNQHEKAHNFMKDSWTFPAKCNKLFQFNFENLNFQLRSGKVVGVVTLVC